MRSLLQACKGWLVLVSLLGWGMGVAIGQDSPELPWAEDLQTSAQRMEKAERPLIILFTRPGCTYCETVRRQHLRPLLKHPTHQGQQTILQIDTTSSRALLDFHGQSTTHRRFAELHKIRLVPVVGFFGPQGETLSPSLVGRGLPDFYDTYLEQSIAQSQIRLRSLKARDRSQGEQ